MSLDVMQFLRNDFLQKYDKLQSYWSKSSNDSPLGKLFRDYKSHLEDIDIASLQGAKPDLLYFLNCAVDDCLVESAESLHSMAKRSFRSCRQRKGLDTRQTLDTNLKELKSTISRQRGSSVVAPHKTASIPLVNNKVHGFQDQFDKIVKKISTSSDQGSSEPNMRAVGIVGIGGSGKTTLASMVFNSREVREKYQIMIWASLTSTLNKKERSRGSVFMEILSGVQNNDSLKTMLQKIKKDQGGSKMADHVLDKYIEHFKEALKRNRSKYLIVLDDVWKTDYWFTEEDAPRVGKPKCILSREWIQKTGGTIVVTSRLEEMAENIVGKRDLYKILPVADEACFDIFLDRATKDGHFKREDEQLRKDIVDKCFGLPLAACTLADMIVPKHGEEPARKAEDAAKLKPEEAEREEAEAAKLQGEGSVAKDKTETQGESESSESESESESESGGGGEADASKPKIEAQGETDALKPRAEAEIKAESPPAVQAKEGAESEVKEAAPEADVSKAKDESPEKVADGTQAKLS